MTLLETIKKELINTISDLRDGDSETLKFDVSFIDDVNNKYGDISTNLAMILAKDLKKDIKEIGTILLEKINFEIDNEKSLSEIIKEINFTANGFINFYLKEDFLMKELERVYNLKFIETNFTNKKVLIEHSSPNLFKPFHIGHLMNNIIGESIVHIMKTSDTDLHVMSFPSDISIGIAKAIYILKNKKNWSFLNEDIIKVLGDAYVEGVKFYEENEDKREDIKLIAKNLFEKNEETEEYQIFVKAKEINIEYFQNILKILGSKFDHLIYESEAGRRGEEIVKENLNKLENKEIFEIGESGAVMFDTKKKKNNESDETIKSVFINSEGNPTYEAKDLGLLDLKYGYFPFDYNFFVTDNEQVPHFDTVLEVAKILGEKSGDNIWKKISENSIHIPHGRLNMKGERMSSRLGNVMTVEEVLNLVNAKVYERLGDKIKDLNDLQEKEMVRRISLSALRISILKSKPGLNIDFDFEKSLNFEGATGPYLLYTYARANSILEKSKINEELFSLENINENHITLIKKIIQVESVLKKGIEELSPQFIVKYLFELAGSFNTFYAKEKIITEDEKVAALNIYLLKRFMKVFKFAMNSIAIEEVERM